MIVVTISSVEEIPRWVPDSVKRTALAMATCGMEVGFAHRLLSDTRMESVWKEIHKQARMLDDRQLENGLAALVGPVRMEDWGLCKFEFSLPEQVCAAFFCSLVIELGNKRELGMELDNKGEKIVTHTDIKRYADRWRSAAKLCRQMEYEGGRHRVDPKLSDAISMVGAYFDQYARFIEDANEGNPYVVGRSSRQRNDDAVRAQVRAIAVITNKIFGKFLYKTLATVASVVFQNNVKPESVRDWCADIPCQ